ncbi:MAG TPA: FkbM family methyltransferase [Candidatus Angelobacter sp.]|nr:FkbM family methyltransferase [Candidatus Angelobacter sp.]
MRPSPRLNAAAYKVQPIHLTTEVTIQLTPFDEKEYRRLIEARGETVRRVVTKLKRAMGLTTAVDAGCGVGFFSQTLVECGLTACGFDARAENVEEARRRFPEIAFGEGDVEDETIASLGRFDLVLCFGLLYHVENPLRAIRNLRAIVRKCLLLESMCVPGEKPALLLREEPRQEDQSLSEVACYPSESSLVKMLYRAGFAKVYRVTPLPDHEDFRETQEWERRRTVLLASCVPVDVAGFRLILEPRESEDPWAKRPARAATLRQRIGRFLASPARRKYITLANRARRIFPKLPIPLRLPFGAWWLVEKSALDHELIYNEFEKMEMGFVKKLLRRDMTVVDVGAHHGLYTLLASKCVGWDGQVVAIEPSPRECRRLEKHLRLNRCANVELVNCAVGEDPGETDLYVVEGRSDWCNSLRPPETKEPVRTMRVVVRRLDDILEGLDITKVDFVKLDVEGAELPTLYGAMKLLNRKSRPAMLVEVRDTRTKPWGYAAREILQFLMRMDYQWFAIAAKGALLPINCAQENYDANLVALPVERTEEFLELLGQK